MELQIMPIKTMLQWAETHDVSRTAVLAATSYVTEQAALPARSIRQSFDDIDREVPGRSISREQAEAYADFVRALPPDTRRIICCCDAGESRSAAICAALCEYYGINADWIWDSPRYHPNMLVFRLMTEALGIRMDDLTADALLWRSRTAFEQAAKNRR